MNRKIYKIYYMSFIGQEIGSEAASLTGRYIGNTFKKKAGQQIGLLSGKI